MKMSRRLLLRALGLSGAAAMSAGTAAAMPAAILEVSGSVSWCHYPRGFLMFRPDQRSATQHLIKLDVHSARVAAMLKEHARPSRRIVLRLTWRPDVDIVAPWQAVEIVLPNGERVAALKDTGNVS